MRFLNITRAWVTDGNTQENYFLSTYSICGISVLKVKRTAYRIFYLFGVQVYKEKLRKQTEGEAMLHLLEASINVHGMPKATGFLRTFQLAELELLKKFDAVCKKHGLTYWLDFGTMLGAVRHKGFIPWDDDVDVAMMREEYERLMKVVAIEFPSEQYSTNSLGFLQIHVKGTMLQLDVFIYDRAHKTWFPEGEKEQQFVKKICNAASKLSYSVELGVDQSDSITNYSYAERKELTRTEVLGGKQAVPEGNIFRSLEVPVGKRFSMMDSWVFPLQSVDFEDSQFPVPGFPEPILFSNYGNWESIPKNPSYHFNLRNLTKREYVRLLEIIKNGL